MATTTTEPADQPASSPQVVRGAVKTSTAATMKTDLPSSGAAVYTFAAEVTLPYNGCLLTFRPGVGYSLDAPLLAYLTAQSITTTAV